MNRIALIFATALVIFSGCRKEAPTPADYFSCDINGKHWEAIAIDPATPFAISYLGRNMFMLEGMDNTFQTVKIVLIDAATNNNSSGTFSLSWFPFKSTGYRHNYGSYFEKTTNAPGYCTDSVYTGTYTMTYDKANKRASGTFAFRARYTDTVSATTKEVEITNGKFSTMFSELQ